MTSISVSASPSPAASQSLSPAEAWSRLLDRARDDVGEQAFRTWLEPTTAIGFEGNALVVGVPDRFALDWNDSKYAAQIASYAPIAIGHPLAVIFRVQEERRQRPQMDLFVAPPAVSDIARPRDDGVSSAPLNDRYTFDHFVVGKSNEMAYAASAAAAQAPGKLYNPLFLYGDTGLGKTHLMQAIAHDVLKNNSRARITYVGTEQFTNEMVAAIQSRSMHDFKRRYRETDILLVDDVQFLRGKESTQEEFFHTFNAIYEAGRQIVLTSDRPPKDIPGLQDRLVSRFEWGMVASIDQPELEHRIAILKKKAQLDHLELTIPDDVIEFVAQHVKSSVRELEGSMIKLLAFASLRKQREITVDFAREALRDKLRHIEAENAANEVPVARLDVDAIQTAVAREWGVTPEGLKSKTRTKTLTTPRQVGMYLCRELLGLQLVEIGNVFGGRDHSTVIHSLERVGEMTKEDPVFADRVQRTRKLLEKLRG